MSTAHALDPVYLNASLAPLLPILDRDDVTDIYINRPGELWAESLGGTIEQHQAPGLSATVLQRLARQVAALSHQGISREHPLLSAILPGGERVQIAVPPATRGDIAIAIRKHVVQELSLDDYSANGAFAGLVGGARQNAANAKLHELLREGDIGGLLKAAVLERKNVLISGGTSTGKTTFLNALLREVPQHERVLFIEDTPELQIRHANAVGLLAARSDLGEAKVTANDLVAASLRMRPDRIILGELRGDEAFAFLRAVNTGHPGSMTTVHADSSERAIEQIALLVLQAGTRLSRDDIVHYVRSTIDVFVQLGRHEGARRVEEVRVR
ncbi:P-type DNA transfer ATPase VirB11 [Sphingomonas sp. CJ99]